MSRRGRQCQEVGRSFHGSHVRDRMSSRLLECVAISISTSAADESDRGIES